MHGPAEPPRVGDWVKYADCDSEYGLITEQICDRYVRVLWEGALVPTMCRATNLTRLTTLRGAMHRPTAGPGVDPCSKGPY